MSKKMTPCEKLGYKVGDKFKVVDGTGVHYAVGSFITLIHDDGSSCPRFNGVHSIFGSGDSFFPLDFVEKVAKLKPAKQSLADAIHQNGGWPSDEANFAAQDKIDGESNDNTVSFYSGKVKPTRRTDCSMWICGDAGSHFMGYEKTIKRCKLLPNWHQTCISREEYYQAYPKADADGWIELKGGGCPVDDDSLVDVRFPDGSEYFNTDAYGDCGSESDTPISHYRQSKKVVKPEFCESVMRSIPEPESIDGLCAKVTEENKHQHVDAKPTIEQLAADYRNAKGYADRKQDEADKASMESDAALSQLEDAIAAIGFVITPLAATVKEPELVAAVKVGDQVGCVESNIKRDKYNGMVGRLHFIDESDTSTPYLVDFGGEEKIWCHEVKFISRP